MVMSKALLMGVLILMTACTPQSICFKETPKYVQNYYEGKTVNELQGNLIIVACPEDNTTVVQSSNNYNASDTRSSNCLINAQTWVCSESSYCEPTIVGSETIGICKAR